MTPRLPGQALGPGLLVTIKGVRDPNFSHINGRQGTIKHWDESKDRWLIDGSDGTPYLLKSENLQAVQAEVTHVVPSQSTPSMATCNMGHSLVRSKVKFDPTSPDENLRRPILCDDCFDTLPESQRQQAVITSQYAMQCTAGCDFAVCEKHYEIRAKAAAKAAGSSKKGSSSKAQGQSGAASVQDPDPKKINFADPRNNKGQSIGVIGFYFPGYAMPWDTICKAGFLGNFFELAPEKIKVEGTANGKISAHSFGNAEAAFQALKFWPVAHVFELLSGDHAFQEKRRMAGSEDRSYAGHGSNWEGMMVVLRAKFKLKAMERLLVKTGDAYLLEHNSVQGRDDIWSDNCDGNGMNWLGLQLMLIRDEIQKKQSWTPYISQCLNVETGAFVNKVGEDHWRDTVQRARKALVDELDKMYPGQMHACGGFKCSKASCGKPTWNGMPNEYCSKICKTSLFMSSYNYSSFASGGGLFGSAAPTRTYTCSKPGCGKPTWNGMPNEYCSRTCRTEHQQSQPSYGMGQPSYGMGQPSYGMGGQPHSQPYGQPQSQPHGGQVGTVSMQPVCLRAGCGKPTWNGLPNEYCSKTCRPAAAAPPKMGGGLSIWR